MIVKKIILLIFLLIYYHQVQTFMIIVNVLSYVVIINGNINEDLLSNYMLVLKDEIVD